MFTFAQLTQADRHTVRSTDDRFHTLTHTHRERQTDQSVLMPLKQY